MLNSSFCRVHSRVCVCSTCACGSRERGEGGGSSEVNVESIFKAPSSEAKSAFSFFEEEELCKVTSKRKKEKKKKSLVQLEVRASGEGRVIGAHSLKQSQQRVQRRRKANRPPRITSSWRQENRENVSITERLLCTSLTTHILVFLFRSI